MRSTRATSRSRCSRIMLAIVVLLVLSGAITCAVETCPEHFTCQWEGDVFMLHCKSVNDTLKTTITDLPASVTRLEIDCYNHHGMVQLTFANLYNITELTLDNINVTAKETDMFQGISNISRLILRNLYWKSIHDECFKSLTNLRSLTLEHLEQLEYMHPDSLTPLVTLESLSLRYIGLPYLNYTPVMEGIVSSSFQSLALHGIQSTDIGVDLTVLFGNWPKGASLKRLDLENNQYRAISLSAIAHFPQLEHVTLIGNVLAMIPFEVAFCLSLIISHTNLKTLYITGMDSTTTELSVKTLCAIAVSTNASNMTPRMPIPPVVVGPQVESISLNGATFLSDNPILPKWVFKFEFPERVFGIQMNDSNNALKYIDVSNFQSSPCITVGFIGLYALKYFNVQNVRSIDPKVFNEMPNVTVLLLGNNDLGYIVANDIENRLFRKNRNLQVLDLAGCQITEIPTQEFSHLHELRHLNLSGNSLEHFQIELHTLKEFLFLNLSDNKLSTLSVATRTELDQLAAEKNVGVDISRNPLQCTCNDTEFVSWVHTSPVMFHNKENTFCTDRNSTLRFLFHLDSDAVEHACNPNRYKNITTVNSDHQRTRYKIVSIGPNNEPTTNNHHDNLYVTILLPAMIVLVFISVSLCVTYKYRWKCAYVWNRFKKYARFTDVHLDEVIYERDAFICYNSNDRGWVCHDLLDHLDSNGISTVIHHRDFLPGSVLEETIRESIDKSRFTVLVLSPDFLSSNWCRLEMQLARILIISQGRDVIVPIILHEFPPSEVTLTLEGILSKSYLQWTEDPDGQALFWDKLITKLKRGGNLRPLDN